MKFNKILLFSVMALSLVLSACGANGSDDATMSKPTEAMMEQPANAMPENPTEAMMEKTTTPEMSVQETAAPDAMKKPIDDGDMMKSPAWFGAVLTNVSTGETFTINDFKGKVLLVETMAQWCPTCKKQQIEVKSLHEKIGMPTDLVTIALDIDPNEDSDTLKTYAANNGFDWIYAVPSAEVSREIGNLYGNQFLNPPSAPILIIDRKGEVHPLPFGIKSADDLIKAIQPYLDGM
jgi:thiol-disulfide isomerase/thioredoxin